VPKYKPTANLAAPNKTHTPDTMRISERAERIEPFWVMEVAKAASQKAREVAHTDRPVVFLNIGEPDFTAPTRVQ
jgi:hypothetical protein